MTAMAAAQLILTAATFILVVYVALVARKERRMGIFDALDAEIAALAVTGQAATSKLGTLFNQPPPVTVEDVQQRVDAIEAVRAPLQAALDALNPPPPTEG